MVPQLLQALPPKPQCGALHGVLIVMLPQLLQALPLNHSVGPYMEC